MAKKGKPATFLGSLAFLFGAAIAVVIGVISPDRASTLLSSVLIILGFVVGFLNITTKERQAFLFATVSLVIVSFFGGAVLSEVAIIGSYLEAVLKAILIFIIPATLVVAIKTVYSFEEAR